MEGRCFFPRRGPIRYAVYVQARRDDFAIAEVCRRLLDEQTTGDAEIGAIYLFCPDATWAGEPTTTEDRASVERAAAAVRTSHPTAVIRVETMPVAPHRAKAAQRIDVETGVRSAALAQLRRDGWSDALIVDTDEIWRRGTLGALTALLRRRRWRTLHCVWTHCVPVLGQPGYPVDGATDKAYIYARTTTTFRWGRIPRGVNAQLPGWNIWHFTGTRRDVSELAAKARVSGHYDDADYDYERWLRDVLPGIRPGQTEVHMYRDTKVWPRVRAWRAEDLADIPPGLHGLLGPERATTAAP